MTDRMLRAPETEGGSSSSPSTPPPSSGSGGGSPVSGAEKPSSASPPPAAPEKISTSTTPATPKPGESTTKEVAPGDMENLFDFSDDGEGLGLASADEVEPVVPEPSAPETPPAVKQEAGVEKPTTPAPEAPISPQGDAPSLDPADPQSLARVMTEHEPMLIEHLSKTMFALSDEDVAALEDNAVEHTPKLLAKTYVKMQQNMMSQVAKIIPAMITKHLRVTERNAKNEGEFYKAFPDLNKDAHGQMVTQYATLFRKANPQAPMQELIDTIGPLVMMQAKVTPRAATTAPVAIGTNPPRQAPFRPAMGGPGSPPSTPVEDPWAGLDPALE